METVTNFILFYFIDSRITANGDCSHAGKRHLLLGRKAMTNLDSILKSRAITLPSHVRMWELDHKGSWVSSNWCFWTVVLEKTAENPFDNKEIQPVHPKGNQSWIFIGRTDAEAENANTLATWCKELTHWKWLWCWERLKVGGEGTTEDETVGWPSTTWWTWVWANSGNW